MVCRRVIHSRPRLMDQILLGFITSVTPFNASLEGNFTSVPEVSIIDDFDIVKKFILASICYLFLVQCNAIRN